MKSVAGTVADRVDKEARYKGQVLDTIRNGIGKYDFPWGGNDSFSYAGPWKQGLRDGSNGKFLIDGVSEYTGQFQNGEMTGSGLRQWVDGRIYEGEFKDGEFHGKGRWTSGDKMEIYEGDFEYNRRSGFGTLRKDADVYRGYFKDHKMHGHGSYLCGNACIIESAFKRNVIYGQASIKWHKTADMQCPIRNGYPHGRAGVFSTIDGSYDFEGDWSNGFPKFSQTSKYIWSDLDRSMVIDPETEVDAGKKKTAPPPKKKGSPDDDEPSIVLSPGFELGRVNVRTGLTPPNEFPIPAPVVTKGKVEEPPGKPVVPVPELYAAARERKRQVYLRLRREVDATTIGESVPLWLRKRSLNEFGVSRLRFPPASTVFIDGECAGSASNQAPTLTVETVVRVDDGVATVQFNSAPAEQHVRLSEGDGVKFVQVQGGSSLLFQIECGSLPGAQEALTFSADFKLDTERLMDNFSIKYDVPALIAAASPKKQSSRSRPSSTAKPTQLQTSTQIPILSLSRATQGEEVRSSRLQLVLVVPDVNILQLCLVAKAQQAAAARAAAKVEAEAAAATTTTTTTTTAAAGNTSAPVSPSGKSPKASLPQSPSRPAVVSPLMSGSNSQASVPLTRDECSWVDCTWELQLLTTTMVPDPEPEPVLELVPELSPEPELATDVPPPGEGDNVASDGGGEGGTREGEGGSTGKEEEEVEVKPVRMRAETSVTVCGRWHAAALDPTQWHALALTLRAAAVPSPQAVSDPLIAENPLLPSLSSASLVSAASVSYGSSLHRSDTVGSVVEAGPLAQAPPKSTLATEGSLSQLPSRSELSVVKSTANPATSPSPSVADMAAGKLVKDSRDESPSLIELTVDGSTKLKIAPSTTEEVQEGVVLGWIPEARRLASDGTGIIVVPPTEKEERVAVDGLAADGLEPEEFRTSGGINSAPKDFWLVVRAGGAGFEGGIKTMSVCAKGDRCNPAQLTECFEAYRQQEAEWALKKSGEEERRRIAAEKAAAASSDSDEATADAAADATGATTVVTVEAVPWAYSEVDKVPISLFCGSGDMDRILLPTSIPEGVYVVEVSDGVLEQCCRLPGEGLNSSPELGSDDGSPAAAIGEEDLDVDADPLTRFPSDMKSMVAVVTALEPSRLIRIKVNAASA